MIEIAARIAATAIVTLLVVEVYCLLVVGPGVVTGAVTAGDLVITVEARTAPTARVALLVIVGPVAVEVVRRTINVNPAAPVAALHVVVGGKKVADVAIEPATNIALVADAVVDVVRAAVGSEEVADVATEHATNIALVAAVVTVVAEAGIVTIEAATNVVAGRSNTVEAPQICSLLGCCRW